MWIKQLFVGIVALDAGILVSGGVFSVLLAVGLIPRFAGKTGSAKYIMLYEEMVVLGTIAGCLVSVFEPFVQVGKLAANGQGIGFLLLRAILWIGLLLYSLFAGVFVGSLVIAIAEMLDSIPIMTRRIGFRHGLGIMVCSLAFGKLAGSLLYFVYRIYESSL
ncbi:MAG: stage V sporulation protein AB [Lachnospiraceae bacterium]|nr:stage V sporulation protein AB [Lachnospiraceae bacterium]